MPTYQLILFVSACALATIARADDWTASCPAGCICKWTNGKKSVKCNDQQLTGIPPTLHTDVQSLQLNGNNIPSLAREEFTALGLVNLQRIYLKRSHIANISRDAFRNLKILVEIDLSENAIETLDKQTFNGNDRLRYLYLYGNPLKRLVAYQFPALPHLRTLDLHDCQISQIDATAFANLELLELLNLKNNLVEIVDEHVFNYMKNLKTLVLEGNPWKCNCKLRRFRNWYINSNLNSLSLMCSSPFVFKNKQWEEVEEIQFACPPKVDIYTDNIYNIDIGSNVTFGCLIYGDPLPAATWDFNGKEFDAENVSVDEELYTDTLWRNLTIFNITNFDAGVYVCSAKNNVGRASANISLTLTEMVQHVIEKGPETFWYFGLILGTFGTVFGLIVLAIMVCWCQKATQRRRSLKNIKGSVSFNDQEKKLLDLSITTNDRQDSCEIGGVTQQQHQQQQLQLQQQQVNINSLHHNHQLQHHHLANGLALEPIQITIESQQHQQRMGSPMAMAMAMAMVQSNGGVSGNGGGSCIAESTTNTTTASNSSTSGQSSSSASSQQSASLRGMSAVASQPAAASAASAAGSSVGGASHHHRGTCPLSHRPLPTFRCGAGGPMPAPYGSIFITLAMNPDEQQVASGTDYHIYPDLLNDTATTTQQQQQQHQQQVTSMTYATLPRNRLRSASATAATAAAQAAAAATAGSANKFGHSHVHEYEPPDLHACNNLCLQNLINYHNLEARLCNGDAASTLCALCLNSSSGGQQPPHHSHSHHLQQQQQQPPPQLQHLNQQHLHLSQHQNQQHHQPYRAATLQRAPSDATDDTMAAQRRNAKYDNMGRRITASGNSTLSLPDEDDELELRNGLRSTAAVTANATATVRRGSFAARDTSGSGSAAAAATATASGTDADSAAASAMVPSVSRLVLPVGCDYVSL